MGKINGKSMENPPCVDHVPNGRAMSTRLGAPVFKLEWELK